MLQDTELPQDKSPVRNAQSQHWVISCWLYQWHASVASVPLQNNVQTWIIANVLYLDICIIQDHRVWQPALKLDHSLVHCQSIVHL